MLVVPFGRREILGVVVGLADTSEVAEEKLLAPLRALELGVPAELVDAGASGSPPSTARRSPAR